MAELKDNHAYDGIQEYDNPMPAWWKLIFFATFLFSLVYVLHVHFGEGELVATEYEKESKAHAELMTKVALAQGVVDEPTLAQIMRDPAAIADGRQKFEAVCAACHLQNGGGSIGPNLTDRFWLHGKGALTDVYTTVSDGVVEKGMPAWKMSLKPDELRKVVAYVGTLRGTNAPNGKAPQGNEVVEP